MDKAPIKGPTIMSYPSTSQSSSDSAPADNRVRVLGKHEYKQAALCLAEAFKDDDVAMYFVDTGDREKMTAAQQWDLHLYIMERITYAHCLRGLATAVGPDYDCVALWMPPGKNIDDLTTQLLSGIWKFRWKLSAEGQKRFYDEFMPLLHLTKCEVLGDYDKRSWYLVYIGTKPGSRGKGYAKTLIEHTTKQADAHSLPTYLECSNPANLRLYNKLGFTISKQITLTRGPKPVELDIMMRLPLKQEGDATVSAAEEEGDESKGCGWGCL